MLNRLQQKVAPFKMVHNLDCHFVKYDHNRLFIDRVFIETVHNQFFAMRNLISPANKRT